MARIKNAFTISAALLLASCSGHKASETDGLNAENTPSIDGAASDAPAVVITDDAPVTQADTTLDQGTDDKSNSISTQAASAQPEVPEAVAATPVLTDTADVPASPRPARKTRKAHSPVGGSRVAKARPKIKKTPQPDPAPVAVESTFEEPAVDQTTAAPSAPAQAPVNAPPVAAAPTSTPPVVEDRQPTNAQAQPGNSEGAEPDSKNYRTYAAIAAIVVLGGYFVFRRRRSA